MDAVLSSSTTLFNLSFHLVPKVTPSASLSPTNYFPSSSKQKLFVLRSRIEKKLSRSHFSSSTVRKSTITCGAITEISETEFPSTVLKADRPVLVEFVATWCGPCRLISPAMESVAQEYGDRLMVVKIDHDANPQLIKEYEVYGLPTLILFQNGQEVPESRREGAITKDKLKKYLDSLLEQISVS